MSASFGQISIVLLPVLVGAAAGSVPTWLIERARHNAAIKTRWDATLQTVCSDFATAANWVLRLSLLIKQSDGDVRCAHIDRMDQESDRIRTLMEQIWLLSGPGLQKASRMVVRHAWALRQLVVSGVDPRADEFDSPPYGRLESSILEFYRQARRELRILRPEELAQREPPRGGY